MKPITASSIVIPGMIIFNLLAAQEHPSIHQVQAEQYKNKKTLPVDKVEVLTGLDVLLTDQLDKITGRSVGLVTNHSGVDRKGIPNYRRLMDLSNVYLKIIFSPEHGLFGEAAAGEKVNYQEDELNFPEIFSLYSETRKPTPESLQDLDLIIYDIQDVGARFYTYISTLGLVLEAAAEAGIPVMVLDRPNPITGAHVEGAILDLEYKSFVGYYPIPVRYGMTVGEIAKMIVGKKWIDPIPELVVIPMKNWSRDLWYDETTLPWVQPSPNIPDLETAIIYPGLCLLEGTNVSEGRGTYHPFKWFGAPWIDGQQLSQVLNKLNLPGVVFKPIQFTPVEIPGMAWKPKYEGEKCFGIEIIVIDKNAYSSVSTGIHILSTIRSIYPDHLKYRTKSLQRLWGDNNLQRSLEQGSKAGEIISSYKKELEKFLQKRDYYLLY